LIRRGSRVFWLGVAAGTPGVGGTGGLGSGNNGLS
jgi:hypothetical protein